MLTPSHLDGRSLSPTVGACVMTTASPALSSAMNRVPSWPLGPTAVPARRPAGLGGGTVAGVAGVIAAIADVGAYVYMRSRADFFMRP